MYFSPLLLFPRGNILLFPSFIFHLWAKGVLLGRSVRSDVCFFFLFFFAFTYIFCYLFCLSVWPLKEISATHS